MSQKIIAVVGSTGAQGGGLVRSLLADPEKRYAVRALTRKPQGEPARALAELGAEVVTADLDDPASLRKAFAGAYGAYCVTNFWELFSPEREMTQAKNMADAAKAANVQHVIWSTLEDTRLLCPLTDDRMPTLQEHYKVPHFDAKGASNHYFTDAGLPVTLMQTSFYWENFIYFGMGPQRGADGKLAISLAMGDKKLPSMAVADIGKCAHGIFNAGTKHIGQTVSIAGEHLTGAQMAAGLTRALGQEISYKDVPPAVYRSFGFPGAEDLGNMFQYNRDFAEQFCAARDLTVARALNPELQTFAQWLQVNASKIHVPQGHARPSPSPIQY
jgi:uncharacterized protein YbjT (DUF2867 family)